MEGSCLLVKLENLNNKKLADRNPKCIHVNVSIITNHLDKFEDIVLFTIDFNMSIYKFKL